MICLFPFNELIYHFDNLKGIIKFLESHEKNDNICSSELGHVVGLFWGPSLSIGANFESGSSCELFSIRFQVELFSKTLVLLP